MSDTTLRTAAADAAGTHLETRFFAIGNAGTQVSNERLQPTYSPGASDVAALASGLSFTGPASQAVTHLQVYAAGTGGTPLFERPLSGDLSFNAAGELNLTAANVTVTQG